MDDRVAVLGHHLERVPGQREPIEDVGADVADVPQLGLAGAIVTRGWSWPSTSRVVGALELMSLSTIAPSATCTSRRAR